MTMGLTCPRDGGPLQRRSIGPAEIHHCTRCNGLWIRPPDLESFLESPFESWKLHSMAGHGATSAVHHATVHCFCDAGADMDSVVRDGLIVDVCPVCGALWLDGGELEALLQRAGTDSRDRVEGSVDLLTFLGDPRGLLFKLLKR